MLTLEKVNILFMQILCVNIKAQIYGGEVVFNVKSLFLLMFSCFMLSACSSSGNVVIKQPLTDQLQSDKSVSISVKSLNSKGSQEDTENIVAALKDKLYSMLVSQGVFKSSVFSPNKADYSLEVSVTDAKIVSNAARLMLGVMAGPSSVEAEVLLKDSMSDKILTAFNVQGSSAAHPMSSETGYENAVRETAANITKALKK
ncbi:MAG: DUF4410 domain-containing protein [Geobacteraceae bacterium]|nr:DUF4410 domain-containing protein [Geobacteraceae bacterium]